jgi:hypothetical protein
VRCGARAVRLASTSGRPSRQAPEMLRHYLDRPRAYRALGSRFHDVRHFYASALIAANLKPEDHPCPARACHRQRDDGHLRASLPRRRRPRESGALTRALASALAEQSPSEAATTKNLQVSGQAAGELACRPGSVHPLARADGHPSRTAVADSLLRSTREHRAGRPQSLAQDPRHWRASLLTLLRVGFTKPLRSP